MSRPASTDLVKAPKAMAQAISSFEKAVGGREALVAAMHANPDLDDAQRYLIDLLSDPSRTKTPIGDLCFSAGVHIGHVLQLFKSGRFARAQVEAIDKISKRLPEVAEDFVSRAIPLEIDCPTCNGTGETIQPDGEVLPGCPSCHATGKVTREPSIDYQRLALEIGGITPRKDKGGGVNIGIFSGSDKEARVTSDDLRNLRVSSDKLLYPGKYGGQDTSDVVDTSSVVTEAEIIAPKSEEKEKQVTKDTLIRRSTLVAGAAKEPPTLLEPPGQRPG